MNGQGNWKHSRRRSVSAKSLHLLLHIVFASSTLGPKLRESMAQQDNGDKQRQIRIEVID